MNKVLEWEYHYSHLTSALGMAMCSAIIAGAIGEPPALFPLYPISTSLPEPLLSIVRLYFSTTIKLIRLPLQPRICCRVSFVV